MTHLEAQSYIMPFIEGKVPENKQKAFVMHMQNCKKCHEELEIYYTLMVGMRQLDNNETLSADFNKDLERDLKAMNSTIRRKRNFKLSAFSLLVILFSIIAFLYYLNSLAKVYNFEQRTKLENQGDYYFSKSLHDDLILVDYDRVSASEKIEEDKKISDFDRIRGYEKMESDYIKLSNLGEGMINVEATVD